MNGGDERQFGSRDWEVWNQSAESVVEVEAAGAALSNSREIHGFARIEYWMLNIERRSRWPLIFEHHPAKSL